MDYKVYVTKGELATIMGISEFGGMVRKMDAGAIGEAGKDLMAALRETSGIYLDNPEVAAVIPTLVAANVITQAAADRVTSYVASHRPPDPPPDPAPFPATYRRERPADLAAWRLQYAPAAEVTEGTGPLEGYIFITGECNDPQAEVIHAG